MARFVKGQSGNPAGKPAGARNRVTVMCADLLGDDAAAVMAKCITLAKKGDAVALRLCVERLVPVRASRDRSVVVDDLPDVSKAADLVAAAALVIARAAAGEMSLSEAKEFLGLISAQRALIETQDLAVRLEVLEGQQASDAGAPAPAAMADLVRRVRRIVLDDRGGGER